MARRWFPAEVDRLRQLKADRVSLPKIMADLNRTKGEICGKWNRMNGYKSPSRKKVDNRGDKTMWTDEALTQRWADRHRA